jgi:hypothetical protein
MGAFPNLRMFRLADDGVRCDKTGLFIGAIPMVRRHARPGGRESWSVRAIDELDEELSTLYGLPVALESRRTALAKIADALERGDLALAQIRALLLRLPEPPSLANDASARGSDELAQRLFESGLLKGGWDSAKHPRTQQPPNGGWFAAKPNMSEPGGGLAAKRPTATDEEAPGGSTETPSPGADASPEQPAESGAPTAEAVTWRTLWRQALKTVRGLLKGAVGDMALAGRAALWLDPEVKLAIEAAIEVAMPPELNANEQQAIDQIRASVDPPKTLAELQTPPTENVLGYEVHHIVEQNPTNLAKSPEEIEIEKFGRALIDDPSNLVYVPRLKHELITAYYNSSAGGDPPGRRYRDVVSAMDFAAQREAGLAALRVFGVLQ